MKTFSQFLEEARTFRVLRTAHYTSKENKDNILSGGFKSSRSSGTYHPDDNNDTVYTTPSSRVGNEYGKHSVSLKIINPKVSRTLSPRQYRAKLRELRNKNVEGDQLQKMAKEISPIQQSRRAISSGKSVVVVPNAHKNDPETTSNIPRGDYIMVNRDLANRSIDRNPQSMIRAKNKPRRRLPKLRSNS